MADVAAVLAELTEHLPRDWPAQLRAHFPDDSELVGQLLLWLHAQRDQPDAAQVGALGVSARYELAARLGAGATASVWRAYDRKLGRDVAIKVFAQAASHAVDEARAACEVTSEHVVRVLDVHDDDPPYLVMELVGEHEPQSGALQAATSAASCRPRDLWEAVRWVRDIARGVHDAHLRNVFHRDLKPHNVLITPISRRAKISDFGLAVSAARRGAGGTLGPGMIVVSAVGDGRAIRIAGTPGYMAPEQARGLPLALDPGDPADRAMLVGVDVWGLGAIAYDLLSGRPPWRGSAALEAWEIAAGDAGPPPLEDTPSGERIPPRLRRIVERALAGAPGDRYASAAQLADELDAALARRPTSFDRSPSSRAALWARRNPQLTLTALVAVLLAAMSLAGYATVWHLQGQRDALAVEVKESEADELRLASQANAARAELTTTEANLRAQADALEATQRALAAARDEYRAIMAAKEQALAALRGDRDVATKTGELYETFWSRARKEAEDAARGRDQAERERDAAHAQTEQAIRERDDARATRAKAERDRDAARAERDRFALAHRAAEADVARLIGELSKAAGGEVPGAAAKGAEH